VVWDLDSHGSPRILTRLELPIELLLIISRDPDVLVTFFIGPDEKKFLVHKEFACHYSPVLKAAFNSQFIEGQTQTYRLKDTTEGIFRLFVQWLYYQQLELLQLQDDDVVDDLAIYEDKSLFGLWILADELNVPRVQNLVIESIEKYHYKINAIPTLQLRYIYDNTSVGSPLRRYMFDLCRKYILPENYIIQSERFPHAFLIDLAASNITQDMEDHLEMEDYFVNVGGDQ
jgi:hypothetical protein